MLRLIVMIALLTPSPSFQGRQQAMVTKHKPSLPLAFVQSQFVALTNATPIASITSLPITVTAGDFLFVICRSGGSFSFITVTSSPANTWTNLGFAGASLGTMSASYTFHALGGSTTFTCTPPSSANVQAMVVLEYHPGFLSVLDTHVNDTGSTTNSNIGTPLFSTTAKGLIITCGEVNESPVATFTAGTIGATTATMRQTTNGDATSTSGTGTMACEDTFPLASQGGIQGQIGLNSSRQWISMAAAWK